MAYVYDKLYEDDVERSYSRLIFKHSNDTGIEHDIQLRKPYSIIGLKFVVLTINTLGKSKYDTGHIFIPTKNSNSLFVVDLYKHNSEEKAYKLRTYFKYVPILNENDQY